MSNADTAAAGSAVLDQEIEERADPGVALERVREGMHLGAPAYKQFSKEMIALVKSTLMPASAKESDLYMLLELAATYRLDPFTREIWAVEMSGKNAANKRTVIMIGRDGLLTVAQRSKDYDGLRAAVVHKEDEFEVLADLAPWGRGHETQIRHSAKGMPVTRGPILGAFCEVFRKGKPPVYFIANLAEYLRTDDYSPWKKQPSVMIDKVAIVNALRLCYRVSGLYIADEFGGDILAAPAGAELTQGVELDYGDDPVVAERLRNLFDAAAEIEPATWLPAKRKLMLAGRTVEGRLEVVAEIERWLVDRGGEVPAPPDPGEFIEDAVVVEDDTGIAFGEAPDGQGELPST
jgi:phage recombination protein Bet